MKNSFKYNSFTGKYEATEDGVTYHLDFEHTRMLQQNTGTIAEWYNQLDEQARQKIYISRKQ